MPGLEQVVLPAPLLTLVLIAHVIFNFWFQLRGDKHTLKGSNVKLSEAELRKLGIGALMFGSYPVQKHDGVASKIHILENTKQIFMCYSFLDGKIII